MPQWDVFISHASEDTELVARPLAELLGVHGLHVWLDNFELELGDSIALGIDAGLANSTFGVVIVSRSFLEKDWTRRELDGLLAMETLTDKVVLPVWHGVDREIVARYSPLLAAKLATTTEQGLQPVCDAIIRVFKCSATRSALELTGPATHQEPDRPSGGKGLYTALSTNPRVFVGSRVGAYVLLEPLGSGGAGVAFRATHVGTGETVCVKVFYPLLPNEANLAAVIQRSIRGLNALRHKNLPRVLDFGQVASGKSVCLFFASELVEGLQLDQWAETLRDSELWFEECISMAMTITQALHDAHTCTFTDELGFQAVGVLHGDIKPANIIVSNERQPMILDFMNVDIHRLLDPSVVPEHILSLGRNVALTAAFGTPGYMAPEQEAHGVVTPQSDVFSLGVTLMNLFSIPLESAYSEPSGARIIFLHSADSRVVALQTLLLKMVETNPQLRMPSMSSVAEEFHRLTLQTARINHRGNPSL